MRIQANREIQTEYLSNTTDLRKKIVLGKAKKNENVQNLLVNKKCAFIFVNAKFGKVENVVNEAFKKNLTWFKPYHRK